MNILFSSGQTIQIAVGETYTVKDDEVYINYHPYKKRDLEIKMSNNYNNADPNKVKVGIRLRDGRRTLPADKMFFNKWVIDGVFQTSLSQCVENVSCAITEGCSGSNSGNNSGNNSGIFNNQFNNIFS